MPEAVGVPGTSYVPGSGLLFWCFHARGELNLCYLVSRLELPFKGFNPYLPALMHEGTIDFDSENRSESRKSRFGSGDFGSCEPFALEALFLKR